ncbi:MAG: hypothetical protein JXR68_12080 [Bacteroidales bacterium]|nr:hypothetical protein [Bacteroidales bacterium]
MINIIIKGILNRRKVKAIKTANKLARLTKKKHLVYKHNLNYVIYTKSQLKKAVLMRKFKKGLHVEDVERKAVYITTT